MFFLTRKTRSLILRAANLTSIWRGFPVAPLPARCETAISCAWTGGSTLIAAQSVRTAASVSSDASFSGIPAILRLSRRPCRSSWSSLSFWSLIVFFSSLISLSLASSASLKGFNCLCNSLEIRSANSSLLGWVISFMLTDKKALQCGVGYVS